MQLTQQVIFSMWSRIKLMGSWIIGIWWWLLYCLSMISCVKFVNNPSSKLISAHTILFCCHTGLRRHPLGSSGINILFLYSCVLLLWFNVVCVKNICKWFFICYCCCWNFYVTPEGMFAWVNRDIEHLFIFWKSISTPKDKYFSHGCKEPH